MTHPGGRPRTVSPDPDQCIRLGEDLVKWATEPTKEWRCLFQQWYSLKMGILRNDWKALKQIPEFLPYYEKAQAALAKRAVDGTMKDGFGQRYIRLYDRDLVEDENEHAKFNAELKRQEQAASTQKIVFEVNYPNDNANNQVKILPKTISTPDSEGTK